MQTIWRGTKIWVGFCATFNPEIVTFISRDNYTKDAYNDAQRFYFDNSGNAISLEVQFVNMTEHLAFVILQNRLKESDDGAFMTIQQMLNKRKHITLDQFWVFKRSGIHTVYILFWRKFQICTNNILLVLR